MGESPRRSKIRAARSMQSSENPMIATNIAMPTIPSSASTWRYVLCATFGVSTMNSGRRITPG